VENKDIPIIHDLASQYAEICAKDIQNERRDLWRKHNSLIHTRVPIICSWYRQSNVKSSILADQLVCQDPFYRNYELWLRNMIYHEALGDDTIFEPWITVRAVHKVPPKCYNGAIWGFPYIREERADTQAWRIAPSINHKEQISQMVATPHAIDEKETNRRVCYLQEAVGDILDIDVDRSPLYECYGGSDLCEALGYLVGIENLMVYMYDQPELIHSLVDFMQKAVIAQYEQAEKSGDWSLTNNFNLGMPYSQDFPNPLPNHHNAKMKQLWFFTCAQAFTLVSPRMFEEFMLNYQLPIMARFGLISYAFCEDVTHKIASLRKIPNLRRIGVTPVSNVRKCAEQIGNDYVLSWKPNPAMICCGFDPEYIRKTIRDGLEASRGCIVDIILKDISTVQGHAERLKQWTQIVREVAEDYN
jgi:hypothetical protein